MDGSKSRALVEPLAVVRDLFIAQLAQHGVRDLSGDWGVPEHFRKLAERHAGEVRRQFPATRGPALSRPRMYKILYYTFLSFFA